MRRFTTALAVAAIASSFSLVHADEFDRLDKNHDGVVTREEFAAREEIDPGRKETAAPTKNPTSTVKTEKGWLIRALERDFKIRKSFLSDADSADPAKLSWTKAKDSAAFYQLDLAVMWTPTFLDSQRGWPDKKVGPDLLGWTVTPSFESHIATDPKASQNSLTYRIPVTLSYDINGWARDLAGVSGGQMPPRSFVENHALIISPTYQTDRQNGTTAMEVEIFYTPSIPDLALGVQKDLAPGWLSFRWRPFIGFELGEYTNTGSTGNANTDIARFSAKIQAELWFGKHLALAADYVHRTEISGDQRSFNYAELSAIYLFDPSDKHFSTGVTWKRGKDAPNFQDVDVLAAWFGVKF